MNTVRAMLGQKLRFEHMGTAAMFAAGVKQDATFITKSVDLMVEKIH